jgi:hypothetical protein
MDDAAIDAVKSLSSRSRDHNHAPRCCLPVEERSRQRDVEPAIVPTPRPPPPTEQATTTLLPGHASR